MVKSVKEKAAAYDEMMKLLYFYRKYTLDKVAELTDGDNEFHKGLLHGQEGALGFIFDELSKRHCI